MSKEKKEEVLFDYKQRVSTAFGKNYDAIQWGVSTPMSGKLKELEEIIDAASRIKV